MIYAKINFEVKEMAETLVEETIQENAVGDSPKARLEKFLRENKVKVFTEKDFDFPKDKKKTGENPRRS